jgi:hypothetical protein
MSLLCGTLLILSQFRFTGATKRDERFPIRIHRPDIEKLRRETEAKISTDDQHTGDRCNGNYHAEFCQYAFNEPCVMETFEAARQLQQRIDNIHLLKDSARDPWSANGHRTLNGMVQETSILELE